MDLEPTSLMTCMLLLEELQHNYNPEDTIMQSYFISILVSCIQPIAIFGDGDNWDYEYEWVCEDTSPDLLQIKAYQELPETKTETIDLFNRFAASEVTGEQ